MKLTIPQFDDSEVLFSTPKTVRVPGVNELIAAGSFRELEKYFIALERLNIKKTKRISFPPLKRYLRLFRRILQAIPLILKFLLKLIQKIFKLLIKLVKRLIQLIKKLIKKILEKLKKKPKPSQKPRPPIRRPNLNFNPNYNYNPLPILTPIKVALPVFSVAAAPIVTPIFNPAPQILIPSLRTPKIEIPQDEKITVENLGEKPFNILPGPTIGKPIIPLPVMNDQPRENTMFNTSQPITIQINPVLEANYEFKSNMLEQALKGPKMTEAVVESEKKTNEEVKENLNEQPGLQPKPIPANVIPRPIVITEEERNYWLDLSAEYVKKFGNNPFVVYDSLAENLAANAVNQILEENKPNNLAGCNTPTGLENCRDLLAKKMHKAFLEALRVPGAEVFWNSFKIANRYGFDWDEQLFALQEFAENLRSPFEARGTEPSPITATLNRTLLEFKAEREELAQFVESVRYKVNNTNFLEQLSHSFLSHWTTNVNKEEIRLKLEQYDPAVFVQLLQDEMKMASGVLSTSLTNLQTVATAYFVASTVFNVVSAVGLSNPLTAPIATIAFIGTMVAQYA